MTTQKHRCAVELLTGAIEGKYKAVILYHLMHGTKRFNELGRLIPDASQRMLTQHLRELERDGLVHREVYREVLEYSLTELGHTLKSLLEQMCKSSGGAAYDERGRLLQNSPSMWEEPISWRIFLINLAHDCLGSARRGDF